MSEASVYCTGCGRWWRPAQIARLNKRKRAPDGASQTGYCRECKREQGRRDHTRLLQDPQRVAPAGAARRAGAIA